MGIRAAVCEVCGYEFVDFPNAEKLDEVSGRLACGDVAGIQAVGTLYRT